ncbi:MAG TPA: heparan-alpha-glucosaminide N-acetyltransferase domain-containing protein [Vicinamibacterales bacterium]
MKSRLASVDALRGMVMIVMALDHVRDFIHRGAMSGSPTDLATTTPILFMTRWVTHFCAPVFMLTAGLGAYFYWSRRSPGEGGLADGRTKGQLSRFLVTRGLWLIVLELTLMQFAYNFNLASANPIFLLVLYVLGACMIILAGLVWLPINVLAFVSLATVVLHNALDPIRAQSLGGFAPVWTLLHQVGAIPFAGRVFIAPYSLIPWFAVMALGFCLGPLFQQSPDARRQHLLRVGMIMTVAFVVVRAVNIYGDPSRWSAQPSMIMTLVSFLNTTKYPPSLSFLLMTLGPALILLSRLDSISLTRTNPLIVFGRVPLFYFVLHFVAAHLAIVVLSLANYGGSAMSFIWQPVPSMGGPAKAFPPDFGYPLWVAYAVWITIVVALYPLCRWFAGVKEHRRDWWLSYL